MDKVKKEKDVNVEILRIITCLSVILFHIKNAPTIFDGKINNLELLKDCVCTICVATFFIISGFFMYRKDNITKNWVNVIKNFIFKIFFPALIINIICNIFDGFFIANTAFLDCIKKLDLKMIINVVFDSANSLLFNHFTNSAAHLWFVPSYMLIIIFYPITCIILRSKKIVIYIVMLIMFVIELVNNIIVYSNNWSLNLLALYIIPLFYSMCGYIIYNEILPKIKTRELPIRSFLKNNFIKRKIDFSKRKNNIIPIKEKILKEGQTKSYIIDKNITITCFILYVVFMILLYIIESKYLINVNSAFCYTDWNSVLSLFITIIVSIFILHINLDGRITKKNFHIVHFDNKNVNNVATVVNGLDFNDKNIKDTSNNIVFAKAKIKNQGNYHIGQLDNRFNRSAHNLLSKKPERIITYIASKTFYIYLIHYIIIVILRSYQFQNKYMQVFNVNFITKGIGIFIYCLMIFVISLFISSIFDLRK